MFFPKVIFIVLATAAFFESSSGDLVVSNDSGLLSTDEEKKMLSHTNHQHFLRSERELKGKGKGKGGGKGKKRPGKSGKGKGKSKGKSAKKGGGKSEMAKAGCPDPLSSILGTLQCIAEENVACASAGYNPMFRKLHNGIDTNTVIDESGEFWAGAFSLVDLAFDINYEKNVGPNQASIRYVEIVTTTDGSVFGLPPSSDYPFDQEFLQHEHALVTVDDECKMVLWDQYGDNKEQQSVDDAANAILCSIGFLPAC